MKRMYKLVLASLLMAACTTPIFAQNLYFTDISERDIRTGNAKRVLIPQKFRSLEGNTTALQNFLFALPMEKNVTDRRGTPVMAVPMPDGSTQRFNVWQSPVQAPELQAKYSEIRTFLGQGIDDPYATIRLDYNPYFGFHAQVLSPNGDVYIDPYARGNIQYYMSYFRRDNIRNNPFHCDVAEELAPLVSKGSEVLAGPCRGTMLYEYRLAIANTGEYAQAVGGFSPASLHAAIVTTVNRVNGVYEKELAVRLTLVANNNLIEFLDPGADPFNGNNSASTLIAESQSVITANIGTSNFDIGHTFSTGGGGLAGLGVVCNNTNKARGITGSPFPVGDAYDIDYVAHEIGHQFGGSHTFNATSSGNCTGGTRSAANAYEVGSGTTIQAYAGICSGDNIQPNSDPYFHAISFDQISNFIEAGGASCRNIIPTGNAIPVITAMNGNGLNLPTATPFTLTATAMDPDGDAITYNWEGWDKTATGGTWNSGATSTTAPLFKSRIPKTTGSRTFPDMAVILANYPGNPSATMGGLKGETLPTVGREMKFKLTVRDNKAGGGGVTTGGDGCQTGFTPVFSVNTISGTGPFVVNVPNGGEAYPAGSTQTVTWSVAGTDAAPINVSNVRITMSTDGGLTYPTVLVASTANDGTESVTYPSLLSNTARIRIEAVGNIFFDISNQNFSLTGVSSGFTFNNPAAGTVSCAGPATATVTLGTNAVGGFSTPINLTASGNPAGTTVSFGTNPVTPGNTTTVTLNGVNTLASGNYTVTITGVAGAVTQTRIITFTVQAGAGPSFTTQPSSQQICEGAPVTFTAAATGGTGYQWQVSTDGGTNWITISGQTASSFTLSSVSTGMNNNQYRVIAASQCGSTASNAAVLTVLNTPMITSQPSPVTLCTGSNTSFNAAATGTNISYQWQVSTNGGTTYTNIAGATGSSVSVNGLTATMNGNLYRVVVSGTCAPNAVSNAALLTVISPVTVAQDAVSTTICETGNVSFSAGGNSSVPVIYQWQVSTDGGATWNNLSNGGNYSGVNASTLNVSNVASSMNNNRYRVLMSNATCTTPIASNATTAAVLTVNARPTVTISTATTTLLPGQTTTLTTNINPPGGGFNIQWYYNGMPIQGAIFTSLLVDVTKPGTYYVEIINPTTGCNNRSADVVITTPQSERFFIYPNPNAGSFSVSYYNTGGAAAMRNITVYNAQGARVFVKTQVQINGLYSIINVDMPAAAAGSYLVVLSDGNGEKIVSGKVLVGLR